MMKVPELPGSANNSDSRRHAGAPAGQQSLRGFRKEPIMGQGSGIMVATAEEFLCEKVTSDSHKPSSAEILFIDSRTLPT